MFKKPKIIIGNTAKPSFKDPSLPVNSSNKKISSKTKELRKKVDAAQNHPAALKIKADRNKLKRNVASQQPIARENKLEYKEGCVLIKKILEYKQKNKLIYFTGKQAGEIFKKHPELNTPSGVKNILIASVNPELNITKINSIVSELFSKKLSESERKSVILTMIRSIKIENYDYLL